MSEQPLVSVIIIFLNEERFLADAIESVLAQDHDDWELLLVDDGSTDASHAIASRYTNRDARLRLLQHPGGENRGMSASRNLGLTHARGEFVGFCDADDVWLPHKLGHQLAEIGEDVTMTYGPIMRWHSWQSDPDAHLHEDLCGVGPNKRGPHPFAGETVDPPTLVPLILESDYYCPAGGLIRAQALRAVGGFEDEFRGMHEDGVVMVKLAATQRIHVSDQVTYLYRIHPRSHTQSIASRRATADARRRYIGWADAYLAANGHHTASTRRAVRIAEARIAFDRRPDWLHLDARQRLLHGARRLGRAVLPRSARDGARERWFARRRQGIPEGIGSVSSPNGPPSKPAAPRGGR